MEALENVPYVGELASLTAALLWAATLCAIRGFGDGISATVLNLFKSVVALVCLAVSLAVLQPELPAETNVWIALALSGLVGLAIGDTALFAALRRVGAQTTSALQCLAPPIAALLAFLFLSEALGARQLVGVAITVAAVFGVIAFGKERATPSTSASRAPISGLLFAVLAAITQAIGMVLARKAFQDAGVLVGTAIRFVPAVVVLSTFQLLRGPRSLWKVTGKVTGKVTEFRSPNQVAALGIAAFFGTFVGVLCLSAGTKYAEVGVVMAISYSFPVWIIPIAWIFLKERTNWRCLLCTILAVAGIVMMLAS